MNKNTLKFIAAISMFVDHIGAMIFPGVVWLRVIGRLAFPIFAFCLADGIKKTSNPTKYLLRLFALALFCQIAFCLTSNVSSHLNILFTFVVAFLIILLIKNIKTNKKMTFFKYLCLLLIIFVIVIFESFFDYGIYGILVTLSFYYLDFNKLVQLSTFVVLTLLHSLKIFLVYNTLSIVSHTQLFSIVAIIPLLFYNRTKGKLSLKYFFYLFYPLHFVVIYLINIIFF